MSGQLVRYAASHAARLGPFCPPADVRGRPVLRKRARVRALVERTRRSDVAGVCAHRAHHAASDGLYAGAGAGAGIGSAARIRGAVGHYGRLDRARDRDPPHPRPRSCDAVSRRRSVVDRAHVRFVLGRVAGITRRGPRTRTLACPKIRGARRTHCATAVAQVASIAVRRSGALRCMAGHGAPGDTFPQLTAGESSWLDKRHW